MIILGQAIIIYLFEILKCQITSTYNFGSSFLVEMFFKITHDFTGVQFAYAYLLHKHLLIIIIVKIIILIFQ